MAAAAANPFPGMNPYLEWHWGDVHQSVVTYVRNVLNERMPDGLLARVEERVYVETDESERPVRPDVRVVSVKTSRPSVGGAAATAAVVADPGPITTTDPVIFEFESEPITEGYVVVRDARGGQVVTLIEVLSEGNKAGGSGEQEYRRKQKEMREAGANVVEIDLIRTGRHVLSVPMNVVPAKYDTAYRACVRRANQPGRAEWYPIRLPDRLPVIRLPLRPEDPDLPLDLQWLIDEAYRTGRYDYIDYGLPPKPPLEGEDAAWADQLLKSKGLR
jgi:hypothetical protein